MSTTTSTAASPPTSRLAIASLVFTILCMPVGILLAILALVRISKEGKDKLGGQTLAIISLCLSVACIPVSGMMAAIAIPNFIKFQCLSKQSEAKSNLKSAYVALESFHAEHNRYGGLQEAGFNPRGQTLRYRYELVDQGENNFLVRAIGESEMEGDVWEIDQSNTLTNVTNGCGM